MEILAPAGNREALERADAAGADAVYLGYSAFSARAGAGNFDREALADAIRVAHLRHMRVYVTVNTLVKDDELPAVTEVLRLLVRLGADAVLVQDPGVLALCRMCFPGLKVHASTQMAIHNAAGVRWCGRMGMKRVVLARECGIGKIARCAAEGTEIEVFAHGAQCVAVSGLCLFSSMVGERSGNRGRCAQPCRLEYSWRGKKGAWLSPRDVCLRNDLPALRTAGAVSLKLEGRLKRPEYVAVVTDAYRRGLDTLEGPDGFAPADDTEMDALRQIFNRGGFMRGYAMGCEDAGVIRPEGVNHQGLRIGRVETVTGGMARVRLDCPLHDGDGLRIARDGYEAEMIYAGRDAEGIAVLRLREDLRARAGDTVYRLTDARQLAAATAMPGRSVRADMRMLAMPGRPLTLTVTDGEQTVTVTGETVSAARSRAAAPEELTGNLMRTGGTVFVPGTVRADTENAFVPVSAVNALRRQALGELAEARIRAFSPDNGTERDAEPEKLPAAALPDTVTVRTAAQAEAVRGKGLRAVFYPEDFREEALRGLLDGMAPGDWLRLPDVCCEDTLEMLHGLTDEYRNKLGGIVLGSVGQLGLAWPVPFGAGSGIPVMNRRAAELLFGEGCAFVTASCELTGRELRTLLRGDPPVYTQVWGRTQLMLLHHCPARTALGLSAGHSACAMCDRGDPDALKGNTLDDRRGYRFPLLRQRLPEGCLVRLMNALPTELTDRTGLPYRAAELTDETAEETLKIINSMLDRTRTGQETTSGHWNRAVE